MSVAKINTEIDILFSCHLRLQLCMITCLKRHVIRIRMCAIDFELHPVFVVSNHIHIVIRHRKPAIKIYTSLGHETTSPIAA
ncbi:hypothetical protein D3C75_1289470 [compost metagenome]